MFFLLNDVHKLGHRWYRYGKSPTVYWSITLIYDVLQSTEPVIYNLCQMCLISFRV